MMKIFRTVAAFCIVGLAAMSCSGEKAVKAPDYSNLTADNHPRVIYTDADFAGIAETVEAGTNPYLTEIHDAIIRGADASLDAPRLERIVVNGDRLLPVFAWHAYKIAVTDIPAPAEPNIADGAIALTQKDRTRYLTCSSSTGHEPELQTWSAQSENSWDAPNPGYTKCGYTVTVDPGDTAVITVRLSPSK